MEFFGSITHSIRCDNLFNDLIEMYRSNPSIVKESPFQVKFRDEQVIDTGGVARDAFQLFGSLLILQCLIEDRF